MKTYQKTHPWINFQINLKDASAKLWIQLGECQSKCEHIARVPLRPKTAQDLYTLYLAKGVLATTAIEGNTLSEEEVLRHFEGKLKLPPSRQYLAKEIDNITQACNLILADISSGKPPLITPDFIKDMNKLVLEGLEVEEGVIPGEIRTHSVGVGSYRGAPAQDCEYLLDRLCEWLASSDFKPEPYFTAGTAILKSIIAHLYLAWIHPFGDGNGRTARLIEFAIMLSSGIPSVSTHILSNHYNQTRTEYYRQLDRSSKDGGEILPFILYAVQGLFDGLVEQLDTIWEQQWDIAWRNYVHELFKDKNSDSDTRRRHLVLDLSLKKDAVPLSKIPEISQRLMRSYAHKTSKTLTRDMNYLKGLDLIEHTSSGYRARKEQILTYLPPRIGST
jgi:Fic family protein